VKAIRAYDSNLAMGLGLIDETKFLLRIWEPGLSANDLYDRALTSGLFPDVTAYRLNNIVLRCFAGRYLRGNPPPAIAMRRYLKSASSSEFNQLAFLHTCRANLILHDFVRLVYWPSYAAGMKVLPKTIPEEFIRRAIDAGMTPSRWAEGQIERVGRYLTGCCSDFGLLSPPGPAGRSLKDARPEPTTIAYLAHDLHFSGVGDNALLGHEDWQLFGLAREDVLEEIKRLSLKGLLIVQAAGDVIRISWKQQDMEALCDVLTQS
jgi:hypothetical protein